MLRVPGTLRSRFSIFSPRRSISLRSLPKILMPTGVGTPVERMSRRFLIGIVQALVTPGMGSARFISSTSSSMEMRSGQNGRKAGFIHSGDQEEYQRALGRQALSGFRITVVSAMENG